MKSRPTFFEDEIVIAFLTIEPINVGHTLIVPKIPFVNLLDMDEATMGHMMSIAKKIGNALIAKGFATGINLIMNNGVTAGQEIFHAHIHLVPRTTDDDVFQKPTHVKYTDGQETTIANDLRVAMTTT